MRSEGDVYQYTTAKFFENIERSDSPIGKIYESFPASAFQFSSKNARAPGGVKFVCPRSGDRDNLTTWLSLTILQTLKLINKDDVHLIGIF